MSGVKFEINDYYDLLNLHKALLEAKFHRNPDNEFVPASPIIARLHNEIVDLLAKHDFEEKGKEDWTSWRLIKNRNDYMEKAIDNAVFYDTSKRNSEWDKLSFEEKSEWAKNFLAPFSVTENDIGVFIRAVTEKLNLKAVSDRQTLYNTGDIIVCDKIREKSLVTFKYINEIGNYPFANDLPLVFLGEIVNMPEHGIFIGQSGKSYWGFHIWSFRELTDDET